MLRVPTTLRCGCAWARYAFAGCMACVDPRLPGVVTRQDRSRCSHRSDGSCLVPMLAAVLLWAALPCRAADFVQVAELPDYGTWGATHWKGRLYVGFYTHQHGRDLPLYRSGINDEKFEFVRMLGSGESLPELFVSPDGSTLHATTEGHSGPRQSPGMHWWTTDSEHAKDWQSQSFAQRHEYRWGIASHVHQDDMYMAFSGAHVGAKVLRHDPQSRGWVQVGPGVAPDEHSIVLEIQVFRGGLYAAGGLAGRWQKPDCGRIYRFNERHNTWESVFPHRDGLIASSAVFDDRLWVGTVFGTRIYSSADGKAWEIAHDFEMKGSWPGVDAMAVHRGTLYASCGNTDDRVRIVARPAGGAFREVFSSDRYKSISAFVTRGDDLYAFGATTQGGGMVLKLK